jgi:hypothetical protein
MKILKISLFISALVLIMVYYGCDDSGVLPHNLPKGRIALTPVSFKPLDQNIDGWYNLWIGVDSGGRRIWYSSGEFNISSSGGIVDLNGNAITLQFNDDTNSLSFATRALITIEKQHNVFPSAQRLISAVLTSHSDSLYGSMDVSGDLALGTVGTKLLTQTGGHYIVRTPTDSNRSCSQGLWFCDTLNNPSLPFGPTGLILPDSGGWVYEGWIVNHITNTYYPMGKFTNPYAADIDGAGPCAGILGAGYNAPGQDWILTTGSCPNPPLNILSGNFGVFISLEPSNETPGSPADNSPFFFRVFGQNTIDHSLRCGQSDNLFNESNVGLFPSANIRIQYISAQPTRH